MALIHGEPIKPDVVLGRKRLFGYPVTLVASVGPPIRRPHYLRKEVKGKILNIFSVSVRQKYVTIFAIEALRAIKP